MELVVLLLANGASEFLSIRSYIAIGKQQHVTVGFYSFITWIVFAWTMTLSIRSADPIIIVTLTALARGIAAYVASEWRSS